MNIVCEKREKSPLNEKALKRDKEVLLRKGYLTLVCVERLHHVDGTHGSLPLPSPWGGHHLA